MTPSGRRIFRATAYVALWLVLSTVAAVFLFQHSEREVELASHDATISPDFSGQVVVQTGPVLPSLRIGSGSRIGVQVDLGKTDARSLEELTNRYASIASSPEGQVTKVEDAVRSMAYDAAARGAALGALPVLVWLALGPARRRELLGRVRSGSRPGAMGVVAAALVAFGLATPWRWGGPPPDEPEPWVPLADFVGPEVPLPPEARGVEVQGDAVTSQTRRLVESMVSTYRASRTFYAEAADAAADLDLRQPRDDETVVLLVSDRHDNIGMDEVARAIGDRGGASYVFDAGDDTSTGERWEAFSLDSLAAAFDEYDGRWAVAGNHDHGDFVRSYLEDLGWRYFDGEVLEGPGGTDILGVDDPRSSGLGSWRDETDLSFEEVNQRLGDAACEAAEDGDRVETIIVHDTNLAKAALARGCVDLVVGGHTHVTDGPLEVIGASGETGYRFTVGTTGGAAYAIAIGSKIRRTAAVALITYRDGRPRGIQAVTLQTTGRFDVGRYVELTY